MKKLLLHCAMLSSVVNGLAQNYSMDWFTTDAGGGTSAGGAYSVNGTIGQPDTGAALTGGHYTLNGGFWGRISALQSPGTPLLSIRVTATNTVLLSWPSQPAGFLLYQNVDLNPANWSPVEGLIQLEGDIKVITITAPVGDRFYRLSRP